jgi:hypothetical protein
MGKTRRKKKNWKPGDLVLNLCDYVLSTEEKKVLELGLKFTPTPTTINTFKLMSDLLSFNRRLRLKEFFFGIESPWQASWMKQTSRRGFEPPHNREPALENYIEKVNQEILDQLKSNVEKNHPNISDSERKALNDLKSNKQIIVKPADKG